jgi:hypothetical protein
LIYNVFGMKKEKESEGLDDRCLDDEDEKILRG